MRWIRLTFELAKIAFEEKRQKLIDSQAEIDKAVIIAPFTGTVVSLNVMKGDLIKAYDAVCIIADTSQLTAAAKMTEDDLKGISVGMPVVVDINNAGQIKGKVKQLPIIEKEDPNSGNGGNPGGGTQRPERPEDFLTVDLEQMPKNVTRGTPLSINIITQRKENAIVIPPSTLRSIGSRTYVQVIDSNGSKREVDVEVGQQTSTEIEIIKGLTPGQKVVGR